jgi:hypothetical protein
MSRAGTCCSFGGAPKSCVAASPLVFRGRRQKQKQNIPPRVLYRANASHIDGRSIYHDEVVRVAEGVLTSRLLPVVLPLAVDDELVLMRACPRRRQQWRARRPAAPFISGNRGYIPGGRSMVMVCVKLLKFIGRGFQSLKEPAICTRFSLVHSLLAQCSPDNRMRSLKRHRHMDCTSFLTS